MNKPVTFFMPRGFPTVEIYIGDDNVESINVFNFAKVIEDHDRISNLEDSDKKYYDLAKLWYRISEELSSEYYNKIDPSKLEVLSNLGYHAMFPVNRVFG